MVAEFMVAESQMRPRCSMDRACVSKDLLKLTPKPTAWRMSVAIPVWRTHVS